jgi:NAD(P) transhydrogenase subunit alpha
VAGETVRHGDVEVVGMANPPAGMATHASFLYANNVRKLLALFVRDGAVLVDASDEIVRGVTVTSAGVVHHAPTAEALGVSAVPLTAPEVS